MKKNISWQVLVAVGLIGSLAGRFIGGIVGNAIGVVGDSCLLIGIVNMIVALIKNRRIKNEQGENLFEKYGYPAFSKKMGAQKIPSALFADKPAQ